MPERAAPYFIMMDMSPIEDYFSDNNKPEDGADILILNDVEEEEEPLSEPFRSKFLSFFYIYLKS